MKRRKERPRNKGVRETRILTHRGMTVNEGQGRKGKDMAGEGWREETMAAAMPTSGANAVITLATVGSGFCSSQGLPAKRVESSLQDVNKPGGTTGTLKTEWQRRGDKFSSILFYFIVLHFP